MPIKWKIVNNKLDGNVCLEKIIYEIQNIPEEIKKTIMDQK